ncbi:MAG: hypothetical protein WCJ84_02820 [Candidatus Peregrinibacteria bacterium]
MSQNFKPYSFEQILTLTWACIQAYFPKILALGIIVVAPVGILTAVVMRSFSIHNSPQEAVIGALLIALLGAFSWMFLSITISIFVSEAAVQNTLSVSQVLEKSLSRIFPTLLTLIIGGILLFLLFCLFLIPGLIFSIFWAFMFPAVAIRGKSGMDALSYSKSLVSGRWWNTFLYFLGAGILFWIIGLLIGMVFGFVTQDETSLLILRVVLSGISSIVGVVFSTVFFLVYEQSLPSNTLEQ